MIGNLQLSHIGFFITGLQIVDKYFIDFIDLDVFTMLTETHQPNTTTIVLGRFFLTFLANPYFPVYSMYRHVNIIGS